MVVKSIMSLWFSSLWCICFVLASISANNRLNITRGSTDKFTNPRCVDGSSCKNCDGLGGASCTAADCFQCRCPFDNPTFYQSARSGHCVKNERIAVSLDDNHSFLAHQNKRLIWPQECMTPTPNVPSLNLEPDVTITDCDVTDVKQHWIWTQHRQLLNLYTLKCLRAFEKQKVEVNHMWYPKVILTTCNASDPRQTWQCSLTHLVYPSAYEYERKYLNYGNTIEYIVILHPGDRIFSQWARYMSSDELLCSQASSYHGCYKYSDGSSMFTVNTEEHLQNCENFGYCTKMDISAPIEATNGQCTLQWEKTKFYNYSQWDYFPANVLGEKQVWLLKRDTKTLTLKVNLTASHHLSGHILRLYIRCESDGRLKQDENETHCILIKFSGSFRPSFFVHEMPTTPTKPGVETSTRSSGFKTTSIDKTTEPHVSSAGHETQTELEGSSSTLVIALVVSVICLLLLAAGIILFLVFKRGRCRKKEVNQTRSDLNYENNTVHSSVKLAETSNQVCAYSTIAPTTHDRGLVTSEGYEMPMEQIASRSCDLYEPSTETAETAYSDCRLYEPSTETPETAYSDECRLYEPSTETPETAYSDCRLYEPSTVAGSSDSGLNEPGINENVYFEPNTVLNTSQPPASDDVTYDYAKPDGLDLSSKYK